MNEKNIFTKEIEVPDIVLKKADAAFARIRKEESAAISTQNIDMTPKTRRRIFKSGWALAACIALIALCGGVVFAAINHFWSDGMNEMLTAQETQVRKLEENGMAVFTDSSQAVTADGITIAPMEVVSDGSRAYLTFSVSGTDAYTQPEAEVLFDSQNLDLLPEGLISSASGIFYEETIADANGNPAREYTITLNGSGEESPLLGKILHLELADLACAAGKADVGEPFARGPWTFDIQLPSEVQKKTYKIGQELSGSIYSVDSVEVTPISLKINYTLNGEPEIWREDNNIPMVTVIRLKDGTVLDNSDAFARPMIDGSSRSFFEAEDGSAMAYGLARLGQVIDPDEIEQITLREFSEAIAWGSVPDEIVAQEYGGEIPFERVAPGEEQIWKITVQ